jgi:hypothetical protein
MNAVKVTVHRYITEDTIVSYNFVATASEPNDIPLVIFQDDTIETVLTKITLGLNMDALPYAWIRKRILRFEGLPGATINPWKAKDIPGNIEKFTPKYTDNQLLNTIDINVVFLSDIKDALSANLRNYYFPDSRIAWTPKTNLKTLQREASKLLDIWNKIDNTPQVKDFIYTKVKFIGNVAKMRYQLTELFANMHSNPDIPFIQLVEDPSKIQYKVYKKQTTHFTTAQFNEWTDVDRLPKISTIVFMCKIPGKNIYSRVTLDPSGILYMQYIIDSRDKLEWMVIYEHSQKIKSWIERNVGSKVHIEIESLSEKADFPGSGSIKSLADTLSVIHPLYHIIKIQDGVLEVAFKRSKNYQNNLDIADFIAARNRLGIPLPQIMDDLIELGMSSEDVSEWLSQFQAQFDSEIEAPKKKSLNSTGCILRFLKITIGFRVQIENVASLKEAEYIAHWIESTLKMRSTTLKATLPAPASAKQPEKDESSKISSSRSTSASTSASENNDDFLKEDIGELMFGGVLGKENRGYFLTLLQNADPQLFLETENYARKCAANSFRQPIVLSKKEKAEIDANGYSQGYDNSVEYGSDSKNVNSYICPRIWCPVSRVPLTPEQLNENNGKCPAPHSEEPILMYNDKYWEKDKTIKHFIGFLGEGKKKTTNGLCLPCCMKKPIKQTAIAECKVPVAAGPSRASASASASADVAGPSRASASASADVAGPSRASASASATADVPGPSKVTIPIEAPAPLKRKNSASANASVIPVKEDNYIMTTASPLPKDRYGIIPKDLFFYLFPKTPYSNCSKTITMNECLLIKGINHGNDSLMHAITEALNYKDIKSLVNAIEKTIDPLTFISIENGMLLQAFMDSEPVHPRHSVKLITEYQKWLALPINKDYKKVINGSHLADYTLSREFAIYIAWRNFITHLRSDERKNPIHLVNIFAKMGIQLVIFKRQGDSAVMLCPSHTDISEFLYMTAIKSLKLAMIMEDDGIYEPMELKQRNVQGIKLFNIDKFPPLQKLVASCPVKEPLVPIIELLRNINVWSELSLYSPSPFKIEAVLIRPDLRINAFITRSKIMITTPQECFPIGILDKLRKVINIERIIYHEDIAGQIYSVNAVYANDLALFVQKISESGFGLNVYAGTRINDDKPQLFISLLTVPQINVKIPPAIRVISDSTFLESHEKLQKHEMRWFQLQHYIGKELLQNYETLVEPLLDRPRKARISILMNTFHKIPQKDIIQVTLEEMPLDDKPSLARWISSINLETRMSIYTSPKVIDDTKNNEWVFSQTAITEGIDSRVILPKDKALLRDTLEHISNTYTATEVSAIDLPKMLIKSEVSIETLPSKWNKLKSYSFSRFQIYEPTNYSRESMQELFAYLGKFLYMPFNYSDIEHARINLISKLMDTKDKLSKIFEDPCMLEAWNRQFYKKYKNFDELWDIELSSYKLSERIEKLQRIETTRIWTTDIDLFIIAKLFDISILVIQRQTYGSGQQQKRGELEDLYMSSAFYQGNTDIIDHWKMRPCIILSRKVNKTKKRLEYSAVVDDKDQFIIQGTYLPDDIAKLFQRHIDAYIFI